MAHVLTKAERWAERFPYDPLLCFAIAWLSFEGGQNHRRYRVLLGAHPEINRALAGESIYTVNFVSVARLLHHLRTNAQRAGVTLPARLTIDPDDEPGYENWRREIDLYREAAGARRAKAKPAQHLKDTPAAIIDMLNSEANAGLADPMIKSALRRLRRHGASRLAG